MDCFGHVHGDAGQAGSRRLALADHELEDKFLELASPVIGQASAQEQLQRLWHLDQATSPFPPVAT